MKRQVFSVVVLCCLAIPITAQAQDWGAKVYEDAKEVISEVITSEMATNAYPRLLARYPQPLVFFPRTSQRIYRRNVGNINEAIRADVGDNIVLVAFLEHHIRSGSIATLKLPGVLASPRLIHEMICYSDDTLQARIDKCKKNGFDKTLKEREDISSLLPWGDLSDQELQQHCTEETVTALLPGEVLEEYVVRDVLDRGIGLVGRKSPCPATITFKPHLDADSKGIQAAVDEAQACLRGDLRVKLAAALTSSPEANLCEGALALASIGRYDRAGFFEHVSWLMAAALKSSATIPIPDLNLVASNIDQVLLSVSAGRMDEAKALARVDELLSQLQVTPVGQQEIKTIAHLALGAAIAGDFSKGEAVSSAEGVFLTSARILKIHIPQEVSEAFRRHNSTSYGELYDTATSIFTMNIDEMCKVNNLSATEEADAMCLAGLKFVDSLVGYSIGLSSTSSGQDTARKAFRETAVSFVQSTNTDAYRGFHRRTFSRKAILIPSLELRYGVSAGYLNKNDSQTRFVAALPTLGLRHRFFETDMSYFGWSFTLLDPLAPFADIAARPENATNSERVFWLALSPEVDVQFGMPWLSEHLVLNAGASLRSQIVTRTPGVEGAPDTFSYQWFWYPSANQGWHDALQFSLGLRYIP